MRCKSSDISQKQNPKAKKISLFGWNNRKTLPSQFDVEEDDVLVVAVFHKEALGNSAQTCEAQALIQMQGMDVCRYDRVELHEAKTQPCAHGQRVFHELLSNVQPALARFDGIAGIGNMAATTHVIGVKDIETDNLARFAILGNACIGLAAEEIVSLLLCQFLDLRECHAFAHHLVPYLHGRSHVLTLVFPNGNHIAEMNGTITLTSPVHNT